MNKRKLFFIVSMLILIILPGCTSSYEGFNLTRVEQNISDSARPYLFIIAPKKERNKVKLYYHGESEAFGGYREEKYRLKEITITDDEMIIETNEEIFIFEKLSEVLAVDADNVLYQVDYEKNYPES